MSYRPNTDPDAIHHDGRPDMSHEASDDALLDRVSLPTLPLDLLVVVGYVFVAIVLLSRPGVYGTPVGVALGLPLLFFAPGYALVSFLFPGAAQDDGADWWTLEEREHGLTGSERVALGFGASVALLPVLSVVIALSPWTIGPETILLSVGGTAVGFAVAGAVRRVRRPPDRRFSVPVREWLADARRGVTGGSVVDALLNVGLAVAVVLAVAAIGYAVASPGPGQSYTSVSLLTQNDSGDLVAEGYPQNFSQGESRSLVVAVTNHEGQRTRYSVVVELQRVKQGQDGGLKVLQDRRLATFTPSVDSDATWRTVHDVTPTMTGEDLRLVYLVYRGDPPDDPTVENAYRYVHVWVSVTENADSS